LDGGLNRYVYVNHNPIIYTDFMGLFYDPDCSWFDVLTGACKEYDTADEYLEDWWDKQKGKICGSGKCDNIYKRCKVWVVKHTLSTGPIRVCVRIHGECLELVKKCKDTIACSGEGMNGSSG
jgi:hypothetical protein